MSKKDHLKLDIYKGKKIPKSRRGATTYIVDELTPPSKIKAAAKFYQALADSDDVTVNGAIRMRNAFTSPENYQMAVVMFVNMVIEYKINPIKHYKGFDVGVAIELEKLRLQGYDLRDHFRNEFTTPLDVLADGPKIIQNADSSGSVH